MRGGEIAVAWDGGLVCLEVSGRHYETAIQAGQFPPHPRQGAAGKGPGRYKAVDRDEMGVGQGWVGAHLREGAG